METINNKVNQISANEETTTAKTKPENSTYSIISKIAYLTGVPKHIFENPHEPPQLEWYEKLNQEKNPRIIRNLCRLRTAIEQHYGYLNNEMHYYLKNLQDFPDKIPQECLEQLTSDGIEILKANYRLAQYIIDINGHIACRISNCKNFFPLWLNWDYVKALFIMPNGKTMEGIRAAATEYYANKKDYPYQVYINWHSSDGNILYNDEKFVTLLYEAHNDRFSDLNKVTDAKSFSKDTIYSFLEECDKAVMMVDCENVDPLRLFATLNNLNQGALQGKISKIILCDDVNTTSAWDVLSQYINIPVEHKQIQRICERKSIVDQALVVLATKEYYSNQVDSIILFGSDSDYWGLFNQLPEARYLVMVEHGKFGTDSKLALQESGIPYCYIDDFCTGNSEQLKVGAVLHEVQKELDQALQLNIHEVLKRAFHATWVRMSTAEREQFYKRFIKGMRLNISDNGDLSIVMGA